MEVLIKTTLVGLFFGTFGTTIGGIIGITFKNVSNRFLSFILEKILDINEKLYDKEVKELVQWLLDKNNLHANEKDIYEQIKVIRNK